MTEEYVAHNLQDGAIDYMWKKGNGEKRRIAGRYEVGRDGVVYSDGMPLSPVGGRWVRIYSERMLVSYLVARAFVPNAEGRPYVRHKNGDVMDNRAENLEWSEVKEGGRKRGPKACQRRFGQYSEDGKQLVKVWFEVGEAARSLGVSPQCIWSALKRRGGMSAGYRWLWF